MSGAERGAARPKALVTGGSRGGSSGLGPTPATFPAGPGYDLLLPGRGGETAQ